jgi:hypothetical protein
MTGDHRPRYRILTKEERMKVERDSEYLQKRWTELTGEFVSVPYAPMYDLVTGNIEWLRENGDIYLAGMQTAKE